MARVDLLSVLYSKEKSPLEFKFDSMWMPSMYNYLTQQDIQALYNIASSIRYSSKIELKYKLIDDIMTVRGFKKFASGTNRVVYSYLEDQSFLVKIAIDRVGLGDNPAEYKNQFLLKPFVSKMFECSPCGTVAFVERLEPITSRQEFLSIGEDIFNLLNEFIIGKYVLEDIGSKYFMNYGLRKGFGVCLLDYPYVYELDGNKLYCNKQELETKNLCGGEIDYDAGFNNLICSKCGKRFKAKDLQQSVQNKLILLKNEGEIDMKIKVSYRGEVIREFNSSDESDVIVRKQKQQSQPTMNVKVNGVPIGGPKTPINNVRESAFINKNRHDIKGDKKRYAEMGNAKSVQKDNTQEIKNQVSQADSKPETIEKTDNIYTIAVKSDPLKVPTIDAATLNSIGLLDKDFEEEDSSNKEEDKDLAAKYYDEYKDFEEEDNFQKIKKNKIIDRY